MKTVCKGEWFELTLPAQWEGKTIEGIFRNEWKAPKKLTHHFRMENQVRLNGEKANWTIPLQTNDKLQVQFFAEVKPSITPTYMELTILYEDEHLLVINKPAFMNTHPNSSEDNETLANGAAFYTQAKGEERDTRHIHRLDRETSGCILFSKHEMAGAILDGMLERREIKRTYVAVVEGLFKRKNGKITEPIGRDRHHPTRRRVSPTGQIAVTNYEVISEDKQLGLSFVKCWLETGRTHQIRVHLSYVDHPIAGDVLYGAKRNADRVLLHAAKLEFTHPFTEEIIICHAPLPKDAFFQRFSFEDK